MKSGDIVRLTKVGTAPGGRIACPRGLYGDGEWAGILALPLGHVLLGRLTGDPAPRQALEMQVVLSNGKPVRRRFRSFIRALKDGRITTTDSVYRAEVVTRAEDLSLSWTW